MSGEENLREEYRHGFGDLPDDILIERGEVQSSELYRAVTPNIGVDVRNVPDMVLQDVGKSPAAYPLKVDSTFDTLPINAQALLDTGAGSGAMVKTLDPSSITVWTSQTSAADNSWYAIAWSPELRLFATVSADGVGDRVMTSPDGINWTSRASAANNSWNAITWSPELSLFAAVSVDGVGNRVMTSSVSKNYYLNYLSLDYLISESYVAVIRKIRVDTDNIAIGAGNYTLSLLINNSVIPNFNSIPFKHLIGQFIDTHIIVPPNATFTVKMNVGGVTLPNAKATLSGALLLSRGYPPNYEIGSE